MYVKNHILEKSQLTLINAEDSVKTAMEKLDEKNFMSLPVVEGDKFVGYIMRADLYEAYYNKDLSKDEFLSLKTEEFIKSDINSLDPDDGIDRASYAIEKLNIPFLPVINVDGVFLGILTHAAIFKAFSDLFNLGKGKQMIVYIFNIPGQLSRLLNVFRREDVNVASMVVMDAKVMGILKVLVRVETDNIQDISEKVEKEGFKIGTL